MNLQSKNIIFDLKGVLFSKDNQATYSPLIPGIELLKKCYAITDSQGNRLHKLYVLSNMKTANFNQLKQQFPDVFDLFDGIVISGELNDIKKPDVRMYNHIISTFNLNPLNSIFIDDAYENVRAAEITGMTGIECLDHDKVEHTLCKLHALTPDNKY